MQCALSGMPGYDPFLSENRSVGKTARSWKGEQIERVREALLRKIEDDYEYDSSLWRTCEDTGRLKRSWVKDSDVESEW